MSFNKSKAMRSAERFLTQGKLQAAISEYKTIVENDPKDINTINMLGDLYAKCNDNKAASHCYQQVAEHYHKQGFAKKAISIYNKIYRIEPNSLEVCEKLAELYRVRGSIAEARQHYIDVSKCYEEKGLREKALEIWEILGELDPQNTDIFLKIAEYYRQDNRNENAAEAFIEAGVRLSSNNQDENAVAAFSSALEILPKNMQAVNGFVNSQIKLGYAEKAVETLEELAENDPYNKEISYLLIDCYFEIDKPEKAEEVIIGIVEREPANYEKLIDLIEVYLEKDDLESTVRILSMVSEHLLIDGKTEKLSDYINEVLARNPEQIEALRLQARFHGWQKDETALQKTLERLVEVSRENESLKDEKYALAQLLKLIPHDIGFSKRLKEINEENDFDDEVLSEQIWGGNSAEVPNFESIVAQNEDNDSNSLNEFKLETNGYEQKEFAEGADEVFFDNSIENVEFGGNIEGEYANEIKGFEFSSSGNEIVFTAENEPTNLTLSDKKEIEEEVESVKFYIEQ
ncbi:MAG: tetratricopeptide repeat protein, partial [Aridibacter sp.]